jgi:3-hydroxybutyrate dehydrogenase
MLAGRSALNLYLSTPFHTIRLALPGMGKSGWGRIINMASIESEA